MDRRIVLEEIYHLIEKAEEKSEQCFAMQKYLEANPHGVMKIEELRVGSDGFYDLQFDSDLMAGMLQEQRLRYVESINSLMDRLKEEL